MPEREQPDLDPVREAMRDHDERLREERTGEESANDRDEPANDRDQDDDDDHEAGE